MERLKLFWREVRLQCMSADSTEPHSQSSQKTAQENEKSVVYFTFPRSQPFCPSSRLRNAVHLWLVSCLRTAIPNAFFVPTRITSRFPLVTPV